VQGARELLLRDSPDILMEYSELNTHQFGYRYVPLTGGDSHALRTLTGTEGHASQEYTVMRPLFTAMVPDRACRSAL
jgi:hypothetical protein